MFKQAYPVFCRTLMAEFKSLSVKAEGNRVFSEGLIALIPKVPMSQTRRVLLAALIFCLAIFAPLQMVNAAPQNGDLLTNRALLTYSGQSLGLLATVDFIYTHANHGSAPTEIRLSCDQNPDCVPSIIENIPGQVVGTLATFDPDQVAGHEFEVLEDDRFEVVAGKLKLKASNSADFELDPTIALRMRVLDASGNTFDQILVLAVLDVNEAPFDLSIDNRYVPPDSVGRPIANVLVADPDQGDVHSYAVLDDRFVIVDNILRLAPEVSLGVNSAIPLMIIATDQGGLSTQIQVLLTTNPTAIDRPRTSAKVTFMAPDLEGRALDLQPSVCDPEVEELGLTGSTAGLSLSLSTINTEIFAKTSAYSVGDPMIVSVEDADQNLLPLRRETVSIKLQGAGNSGEIVTLTETSDNSGEFVGYVYTSAEDAIPGNCVLTVAAKGKGVAIYIDPADDSDRQTAEVSISPVGFVFDDLTGQPLNGVVLQLINAETNLPAEVRGDGPHFARFPSVVSSGEAVEDANGLIYLNLAGEYRFPAIPAGDYRLRIFNDQTLSFSSRANAVLQQLGRSADSAQLSLASMPFELSDASRGLAFHVPRGSLPRIDIPIQRKLRALPPSAVTAAVIEFMQFSANPAVGRPVDVAESYCANGQNPVLQSYKDVGPSVPGIINLTPARTLSSGLPAFIRVVDLDRNLDRLTREQIMIQLDVDASLDREYLILTETGLDTGEFVGYINTTLNDRETGNCILGVIKGEAVKTTYVDAFDEFDSITARVLVDPFGKVFSSLTGELLDGAIISLIDASTGELARVFGDGPTFAEFPNPVVTGTTVSDGAGLVYQFSPGSYRFPFVAPGNYRLVLTDLPIGMSFPSTASIADLQSLPGAPFALNEGYDGSIFAVPAGPPVNIDLPVDEAAGELFVSKQASKSTVAIGDFLQYQVLVQNTTNGPVSGSRLVDRLPQGFRYQSGSLRVDGEKMDDPILSADGRTLQIPLPTVTNLNIDISYVTEVTVGAIKGAAVNEATVAGRLVASSNVATARVLVTDDLYRDKAILIGQVSLAQCSSEYQAQAQERPRAIDSKTLPGPGLAGVRVFLEDGSYAVTDDKGFWHVEGIEPGTHVVQLDLASLPARYEARPCHTNTRFAGSPYSQFVDVKGGTLWRADFQLQEKALPESTVELEQSIKVDADGLWVSISATNSGPVAVSQAKAIYTVPKGWLIVPEKATLDGIQTTFSESIVGSLWHLGDLRPDSQKVLRFALIPVERTLVSSSDRLAPGNKMLVNAEILNSASEVRLSFQSPGTQKGRTSVSSVPLNRLADGVDTLSVKVTATAVGSWGLDDIAETTAGLARDANTQGLISIFDGSRLVKATNAVKLDLDSRLTPRLLVDGVEVGNDRIGFRVSDETTGKTLYSYIGIDFGEPGPHKVELQGVDKFSNTRYQQVINIVRVGEVFSIRQSNQELVNVADGRTPVRVQLELRDKAGELIEAGYRLRYESEGLRALDKNLSLSDLTTITDGDYVSVSRDGIASFNPVSQSGVQRLKLSYNGAEAEVSVYVEPEKRDWILVGMAEGTVAHKTLISNMQRLPAAEGKDELDAEGRVAFYAKGQVKGEYVLTLAYDSAKIKKAGLQQAIDPNAYYSLYGDKTAVQYDAASREKLYLKLEKKQFYALFGDISTNLTSNELSTYSRSLTGIKSAYKGEVFEFTGFVSEANQAFVKDEIRGDGTSGIYRLQAANLLLNSEKIRLETRDRFHSQQILSSRQMTRYIDYSIDYDAGTLFFKEPVFSQDSAFNPVYIIVDYELEANGQNQLNAGGRIAYKPNQAAEIGVTLISEGVQGRAAELLGSDLKYRVDDSTEVRVELATSRSEIAGESTAGTAALAEISHRSEHLKAKGYIRQQQGGFGLGQQARSEAGTRKMGTEAVYAVTPEISISGDIYRETNLQNASNQDVAAAGVHYQTQDYSANAGVRAALSDVGGQRQTSNQLTLGSIYRLPDGKTSLNASADTPLGGQGQVANFPQRLRVGLDYKLNDEVTLKAEQEFSWGEALNTQKTRVGMNAGLWKGGELVTSVTAEDEEYAQRLAAVAGLKQHWKMNDNWRFDFGVDRSQTIKTAKAPPALAVTALYTSPGNNDFTAVTFGAKFRKDAWDLATRVEYRTANAEDKTNIVTDLIHDLDAGQQLLARLEFRTTASEISRTDHTGLQLGYVYRPSDSRWSLFNRLDLMHGSAAAQGLNTRTDKVVNNLNANYLWRADTQIALQYGLKYVVDNFDKDEYRGLIDLYGLEIRHDMSERWDVGVQAGRYNSYAAEVVDYTYGVSVGYSLARNAWMSLGYNFSGISDQDFSVNHYKSAGIYLKYRLKFDQIVTREWFRGAGAGG